MKEFVILLIGLQIFWASTATTTTVAPLPEISSNLDQQCGSYCYTVLRTLMQAGDQAKKDLEANAITIQSKDNLIKKLEAKIDELKDKLAPLDENEGPEENNIQSSDDLVSSISRRIDAISNEVKDITQINLETKEQEQ